MFDFKGKNVVVTGGEKGIGKAIVKKFYENNAQVIIVGIDESAVRKTKEEIGNDLYFYKTDISNEDEVKETVEKIKKDCGLVDILVNNAGIHLEGDISSTAFKDWRNVLSVNLDGAFLMSKYIIEQMKEKGKGAIVSIGSEAGIDAFAGQVAYNVSKAGIIHLTKSIAIDFADENIRANAIAPGTTMTPLVEQVLEEADDPVETKASLENIRPLKRLGKPEEIATAVMCLASDELGYATGSVLSIDGGKTAS